MILPENEFPPLNAEARTELARSTVGPILEQTYQRLRMITPPAQRLDIGWRRGGNRLED